MRLRSTFAFLLCLLLFACGPSTGAPDSRRAEAHNVTVFAASSLADAFSKLGEVYEDHHPGADVRFNFSASDTLATQIAQGAPADVFAAASETVMRKLPRSFFLRSPQLFASNELVIIAPKENAGRLTKPSDLGAQGLKLVLAAPGVPAGDYARQVLDNLGVRKQAENNVVSNEVDDKSVVSKVLFGDADAGIVYVTDLTSDVEPRLIHIKIPKSENVLAHYPIVALRDAPDVDGADQFVSLVLSPTGMKVLNDFGFGPP